MEETRARIPPVSGWFSYRGTLARPASLMGRGLHTGRACKVTLLPAQPGHGVIFRRLDKNRAPVSVPAALDLRISQPLCTALKSREGPVVRTTEHLLAALRACGIDDVLVDMTSEELPILDGSAQPWITALCDAGRQESTEPQRFIEVLQRVEWAQGPHQLSIEPCTDPGLELDVTMTMKDLGRWHWQGMLTPALFREEIAAARSFGRLKLAIPAMLYGWAKGIPILRGAGPWCAATIIGRKVIGGTRMPDEFVRHKLVDMLGDFALLGAPLLAKVTALRPTHDGNFHLMEALIKDNTAWRLVEIDTAQTFGPASLA
jgi:UDP-3-O-[3-hydroxymyristoyl] N-acetylglucosamine deacetylase